MTITTDAPHGDSDPARKGGTGASIVTQGDAANLVLPDETVDLVVTSPPYFGLRSYQDDGEHYAGQIGDEATPAEYLNALMACTAEWMRVLKPGGSIFVNLGDSYYSGKGAPGRTTVDEKSPARTARRAGGNPLDGPSFGIGRKSLIGLPWRYAIRCIDELGLILRAEIIWEKKNGLPESVTDRVRRSHEQLFHFVKQPRYYSAVDEIREDFADGRPLAGMTWEQRRARGDASRQGEQSGTFGGNGMAGNLLGKLPGSVWSIPASPLIVPAHLGVDHFACVDDQTEVLTRRGWLVHDQIRDDDEVAGTDLDTGLTRWTRIHGIHRYDYDGDLIAADARGLSMRLTPNHRTLVHRHAGRHRLRQPVEVVRADEVTSQHGIPRAVNWADDGREKAIGVDLAALCGWVAAEGWVTGKRVHLSQSQTANPQHVATIDALLTRLGGARRHDRQRTASYNDRPWDDVVWELPASLAAEMRMLLPGKTLPAAFGDLPMDEARALLEAFIAGDGHDRPDGRRSIFQKFRQNLDVLQAIAVRCGYNTTLTRDDSNGRWVLYLNPPRPARLRRADGTSLVGREHYKGTVWCLTTGTGTFVARRRGTVFVTGNSYPPELVRRIVLGWSPREVCTACGEGRRPVKVTEREHGWTRQTVGSGGQRNPGEAVGQQVTMRALHTITGYACVCPDVTAPATPGVVLDPFMGTGTTVLVAEVLGRVGIGVDLSADYVRLARWRTMDPAERRRAAADVGDPTATRLPDLPDPAQALF